MRRDGMGGFARVQSLRLRVLLLVLLVLLPVVALLLFNAERLREARTEDAQRNALRFARAAASEEDRLIEGARQLLTALARLPAVHQVREDCTPLFRALLPELPQYTNLGAALPDGTVYCSALDFDPSIGGMADYNFFRQARDERLFAIGEYVLGRVSGRPALGLGYPVLDAGGEVVAVVFAGIDLGWLDRVTQQVVLPEHGIALVIGRDGAVLASRPPDLAPQGTRVPPTLADEIRVTRQGAFRTDVLGGVDRIYAFTPLRAGFRNLDLWVVVGVPASTAFAEVNDVTRRGIAAVIAIGIVSLAAAWLGTHFFVLRPVRALARTAERLRRGDFSARTGMVGGRDELSALAHSFDEMAASLERSSADLRARAAELGAVAASASAVVRNLEIERVAEVVVEQTRRSLQVEAVILWLAEEDERLRLVAERGMPPALLDQIEHIPFDAPMPAAEAARKGRVVLVRDLTTSPRYPHTHDFARAGGWHSALALPLSFGGRLVGVLGALRHAAERFPAEQVRLANALGDIFAAAVANARLFRAVQEALSLREAFIAAAAHELRTPATSLKSYTQLLLRREDHDEKERHALERIAHLAERTAQLANELEEAHALSAGLRLRLEPVRLRALLEREVAVAAERNEQSRFELDADEEIEVEGDPDRLAMSIAALLQNAVRYPGTSVRVTLERRGEVAVLRVRDDGPGIPADRLPHVFEPLFEPWPPGSPWYSGVIGLGLHLAHAVMRAHGGTLEVESEEGRGSTFTAVLPLRSEPDGAAAAPA